MKKIRIIVLFSGSASSLRYLLKHDERFGVAYEVVAGISNKKGTNGETFCKEHHIPFIEFNTKKFCIEHGYHGQLKDMPAEIREAYYAELLEIIKPFNPDLILLSGFMLNITEPLLGYCDIINVHPADLTIVNEKNKRKYTGGDAVTLAISSGETSTASTIHYVEEVVDGGKIIYVSDHLPVEPGMSAKDHQERMKMLCDGPAYKKALEIISEQRL